MNRLNMALVLGLAVAAAAGPTAALADSPVTAAAHACLEGAQIDYFQVVDAGDEPADLDFGGLAHGSDQIGPYVIAANHGECVDFIAKNKGKGKSGKSSQEYLVIKFTTVLISQ